MDNESKNGHKHGTCGGVSLVKVVVLDRYKLYFLIKNITGTISATREDNG